MTDAQPTMPEFVPPDTLRLLWTHTLAPMVRAVRDQGGPHPWIAEDVYAACLTGQAACYIRRDTCGHICGMVVAQKRREWSRDEFYVWICFHHDGTGVTVADIWPWLRDMARQAGCDVVTLEGRKGWERVLTGARATGVKLECEV